MTTLLHLGPLVHDQQRSLRFYATYFGFDPAGLRVKRVDLLHRQITVAEQLLEVRGRRAVGPPETGAGLRMVTLPPVAAEALAEHLSRYAEAGPDGLVFPAERGAGHLRRPPAGSRARKGPPGS